MRQLLAFLAVLTMVLGSSGVLAAPVACRDCPAKMAAMTMAPDAAMASVHGDRAPTNHNVAGCVQLCALSFAVADLTRTAHPVAVQVYERASFAPQRPGIALAYAPPSLERPPKVA
jgi:hypothetical protein